MGQAIKVALSHGLGQHCRSIDSQWSHIIKAQGISGTAGCCYVQGPGIYLPQEQVVDIAKVKTQAPSPTGCRITITAHTHSTVLLLFFFYSRKYEPNSRDPICTRTRSSFFLFLFFYGQSAHQWL